MSVPALLGRSSRTLGGRLRHSQLAGSTVAGLAVAAALSLTAGVHRSASKVLPLFDTVGERSRVRCRSELNNSSSHGQSILAALFPRLGMRRYLQPFGMGLWSHRLSFALTLCLSRGPLVSLHWRVPSTSTTWHGCRVVSLVIPCARSQTHRGYPCTLTTQSRTRSRILFVPHWGYRAPSRGSRPVLASSLLGFLVVLLRASHLEFIRSLVLVMGLHTTRLQAVVEVRCTLSLSLSHSLSLSLTLSHFPEDVCEAADEEEGHCVTEQITDSTALANTPGLRAEGTWPWLRSLAAFLVGREWSDRRLVRVAFVLGPFLFFLFSGCFHQVSR